MATKKTKKTEKPKQHVTPPEYIDEDGCLCVKGEKLWKWRALDSELRTLTIELERASEKINALIAATPELAKLYGDRAGLAGQVSAARGELTNVQQEIEKAIGVSLKECAFDDKSGRIYNLSPDGERGDPVKSPKKRRPRKT
jgi:hypothetical protein